MISSGLMPPEGNAPTGSPASDFLAIIRDAIFVGDKPARRGTPTNMSGVGTGGGPPIDERFSTFVNPPIIASILLKSIAILFGL